MPVDPATLPGYRPPPEYRPPRRSLSIAVLIALGGASFFFVFFLIARGDPTLTRTFTGVFVAFAALVTLERFYSGYQEDGLLGGLHRVHRPYGNYILGDDVEHFNRYSAAVLFVLIVGAALTGVLQAV